jgi:hypothetical protein
MLLLIEWSGRLMLCLKLKESKKKKERSREDLSGFEERGGGMHHTFLGRSSKSF